MQIATDYGRVAVRPQTLAAYGIKSGKGKRQQSLIRSLQRNAQALASHAAITGKKWLTTI